MAALLRDQKLPERLKPYVKQMESLYNDPEKSKPRRNSNSDLITIDNKVLNMLIDRLNLEEGQTTKWVSPEDFCLLSDNEAVGISPVQA